MADEEFAHRGDDGTWHAHRQDGRLQFYCTIGVCAEYGGKRYNQRRLLVKHRNDAHHELNLPVIDKLGKEKFQNSYIQERYQKERQDIDRVLMKQSSNYRLFLSNKALSKYKVSRKEMLSAEVLEEIDKKMEWYESPENRKKRADKHIREMAIKRQCLPSILNEEGTGQGDGTAMIKASENILANTVEEEVLVIEPNLQLSPLHTQDASNQQVNILLFTYPSYFILVIPYDLPLALPSPTTPHLQKEQDKAEAFVHHLQTVQSTIVGILQRTQEKQKIQMYKRRVPHSFQVGDRVWLHHDKRRFKEKSFNKIKRIRYGPYTIIQQVSDNAFQLDLPKQLGIHDVVNVDLLKHYHESILKTQFQPSHPVDVIPDSQLPLPQDRVFDTKTRQTRQGSTKSYLVAKQGQFPHQARWIPHHRMLQDFPSFFKGIGVQCLYCWEE